MYRGLLPQNVDGVLGTISSSHLKGARCGCEVTQAVLQAEVQHRRPGSVEGCPLVENIEEGYDGISWYVSCSLPDDSG